ncbi:MAG TPA: hypothetical protein VF520_09070 [Thermoleophilaceae bacterium]
MGHPRVATLATLIAALVACLPAATATAAKRTVPRGFHGVDYDREVSWAPQDVQTRMWAEMARTGVESARVVFDWSEAQKEPGVPTSFHETDPIVRQAASHGVDLLPVVLYAPTWARVLPQAKESAPSSTSAYAAYLKELVARYGPRGTFWAENPSLRKRPIRAWQVWNEPDMEYQWKPREGWMEGYGALLDAAATALREADPRAEVVLAALTNVSWDTLDQLYDAGRIAGNFDAVALNAYTKVPKNLIEVIRRGRRVMRDRGDGDLPIRVTEFGASASAGRIVSPGNEHLQVTDDKLARLVTRGFDELARYRRSLGIESAYWYTWASSYDPSAAIFDFSGLISYGPDGTKRRPALRAYRNSARRYEACAKDSAGACVKRR